jgi:hypothetical protein
VPSIACVAGAAAAAAAAFAVVVGVVAVAVAAAAVAVRVGFELLRVLMVLMVFTVRPLERPPIWNEPETESPLGRFRSASPLRAAEILVEGSN